MSSTVGLAGRSPMSVDEFVPLGAQFRRSHRPRHGDNRVAVPAPDRRDPGLQFVDQVDGRPFWHTGLVHGPEGD